MTQANPAGRCRSARQDHYLLVQRQPRGWPQGWSSRSPLLAGEDDNLHSCLHEIRLSLNSQKEDTHKTRKHVIFNKTKTTKHESTFSCFIPFSLLPLILFPVRRAAGRRNRAERGQTDVPRPDAYRKATQSGAVKDGRRPPPEAAWSVLDCISRAVWHPERVGIGQGDQPLVF